MRHLTISRFGATSLLALLSFGLGWPLSAQLSTASYWQWRTPSAPAITPGGGAIVYSLSWNDPKSDATYSNLWLVSIHGENRPLTTGDYSDTSPKVSPDGTRVAYLSNRSGSRQIHVRWLDGRNEAQITRVEQAPSAFAWLPDSSAIAFLSRVPGEPAFRVNLPKPPAGAKWATGASVVTNLRWRADRVPGQGIVAGGETHLFVVASDGGAPRQITPAGYSFSGEPSFTPDGRQVVLVGRKEPEADRKLYADDLYLVNLDGGVRLLAALSGNEANPVVSPAGDLVAFTGFEDKGKANHTNHLYTIPLQGTSTPKLLSKELDRNVISPVWRADSKALFAVVENEGQSHLYQFALDGGGKPLTAGNGRFATAYGSTEGFTVSRDGRFAITHSTPDQPKEIVTLTAANPAKVTRLTFTNDGVLSGKKLGAVEEIRYASFDKRSVQGWVIKPPDFDPAKKYPLILDIHGGPHAMYGVEFNWQMQTYASRGYVVLYTNPRGSTGYGEEFGDVIHARYPGDDYQDLMAGVDTLLAKGYVDAERLYVTGGSGGGILTAWIVTQTGRFAAAVSQYPVINWITQAGSSDIPLVMHRWMKATPWENPQQYLSRSPLFQVSKVTTPTMLLTGEEDWRTPIAQTEEFYVALKTRGIETAMVRFPNEPHGIRGAYPSHWIAKVEYILGWFEQHPKRKP